ncbi:MAG: manganese transport transcriptional regulator [Methanomassiliicoccales archaeon PtaU1.Bin124]|nr:MAG: manganese transport transcriptional regulator [Methanomassiliicoccales archaeon PtaU1.Bin124]
MVSENIEEYLECIWELSQRSTPVKTKEISDKMKVSPASVTEMMQRLAEMGYVQYEKYKGVTLTQSGNEIGTRVKRRHRLMERFLYDIIGLEKKESHEEACRMEHTLSDESERRICQLMNNPKTCPDGDPIPECSHSCTLCVSEPSLPLSEIPKGETGVITHLKCDDTAKMRRIIAMGFVPGRNICVEDRLPMGGPLLLSVQETKIALAREYASMVHVLPSGKCSKAV